MEGINEKLDTISRLEQETLRRLQREWGEVHGSEIVPPKLGNLLMGKISPSSLLATGDKPGREKNKFIF